MWRLLLVSSKLENERLQTKPKLSNHFEFTGQNCCLGLWSTALTDFVPFNFVIHGFVWRVISFLSTFLILNITVQLFEIWCNNNPPEWDIICRLEVVSVVETAVANIIIIILTVLVITEVVCFNPEEGVVFCISSQNLTDLIKLVSYYLMKNTDKPHCIFVPVLLFSLPTVHPDSCHSGACVVFRGCVSVSEWVGEWVYVWVCVSSGLLSSSPFHQAPLLPGGWQWRRWRMKRRQTPWCPWRCTLWCTQFSTR